MLWIFLSVIISESRTLDYMSKCNAIPGWGHGGFMCASLCCFVFFLFLFLISGLNFALWLGMSTSYPDDWFGDIWYTSPLTCLDKSWGSPKYRVETLQVQASHVLYKINVNKFTKVSSLGIIAKKTGISSTTFY